MLARVRIQHELRQRSLQTCERTAQKSETRPGDAPGCLQIEQPQSLGERDVIERRACKTARRPKACDLDVAELIAARWHGLVQQIGQLELPSFERGLHRIELRIGERKLLR